MSVSFFSMANLHYYIYHKILSSKKKKKMVAAFPSGNSQGMVPIPLPLIDSNLIVAILFGMDHIIYLA